MCDHNMLLQMCETMDENVTAQLYKVGGANYTTIASLAWRLERGRERERTLIRITMYRRAGNFHQEKLFANFATWSCW